jgi:DNA-binding CsgD family transcriptional regulator
MRRRLRPGPTAQMIDAMPRLGERQYRAVLDVVGEVHDAQDLVELRQILLPALRRAVPAEISSYNEVLGEGGAQFTLADPELPDELLAAWARHAGENPLVSRYVRTRDGRPYRFSDVTTRSALHSLALYRDLYRPLGVEHQIAFALPSPRALTIGIALSRSSARDFSDAERTMLEIIRPHLIQAYRNAQLRERADALLDAIRSGLATGRSGMVVIDGDGTVSFAGGTAAELAERIAGSAVREGNRLDGAIGEWLARGEQLATFTLERGETVLVRRLRQRGATVLMLEPAERLLEPRRLRDLGLTAREAEVLSLLAHGRGTGEVAAELGLSVRTVHKHAQAIHAKLGVHNRAQAIATAWAAAGAAE